jgi:hypothetical protein
MLTLEQKIKTIFYLRKNRVIHPCGIFKKSGKWYPNEIESQHCCNSIREPSGAYPYSLMTHCRSKVHITNLLTESPNMYDPILLYYDKENIPLLINENVSVLEKETMKRVLNGDYAWL